MKFVSSLLVLLLFLTVALSVAGKKKPPTKPVNLNTATSEELQQVPGIGPATAEKILQMRKYLTVGKPAAPKSNAPPHQGPDAQSSTNPEQAPPAEETSGHSLR